jgi:quercetin dioxygenase-like cupin family protein
MTTRVSSTLPARPAVVAPDAGEPRWYDDELVTLRLTGAMTGDRVSVVELDLPAGATTPLHRQPYDDETLYVLAGAITVHVDGRDERAEAGAIVFIPRDTPHALRAEEASRLISFGSPAGQERFFRVLSVPAPARELPPAKSGDPHPAAQVAMQQTAYLNGVELLGEAPWEDA